jgi:hypothetical protein
MRTAGARCRRRPRRPPGPPRRSARMHADLLRPTGPPGGAERSAAPSRGEAIRWCPGPRNSRWCRRRRTSGTRRSGRTASRHAGSPSGGPSDTGRRPQGDARGPPDLPSRARDGRRVREMVPRGVSHVYRTDAVGARAASGWAARARPRSARAIASGTNGEPVADSAGWWPRAPLPFSILCLRPARDRGDHRLRTSKTGAPHDAVTARVRPAR